MYIGCTSRWAGQYGVYVFYIVRRCVISWRWKKERCRRFVLVRRRRNLARDDHMTFIRPQVWSLIPFRNWIHHFTVTQIINRTKRSTANSFCIISVPACEGQDLFWGSLYSCGAVSNMPVCSRTFSSVFLNRRSADLYRALASIIPGREKVYPYVTKRTITTSQKMGIPVKKGHHNNNSGLKADRSPEHRLQDFNQRERKQLKAHFGILDSSVSQPPGPGINYTGPREVLMEFVILVF